MVANLDSPNLIRSKVVVANTTAQANLDPGQLIISTTVVNTSALALGANVLLTTSKLSIGNSSTNLIANSSILRLANSTVNTGMPLSTLTQQGGPYFLHANGTWQPINITYSASGRIYQSWVASDQQAIFTVSGGYPINQIDVYYNGIHLFPNEYIQDGSSVTLNTPVPGGTGIEVVGYESVSLILNAVGLDTQIQYNNAGSMGASANLTYSFGSNILKVSNTSGSANVQPTQVVVGNSSVYTTVGATLARTGSNTFTLGTSSAAANGYTFLPNGILMQWGWVASNSSVGNITFPVAFPTAIFSYQATSNSTVAANLVSIIAANTTIMNVRSLSVAAASNSWWMAIGN
jgi:hypothetical protein